jgi:hypothetical protein
MSNEAALTQWQSPWNFTVTGPGTIKQSSTFNIGFRADIRKRRLAIHVDPIEPPSIALNLISTSSGSYICSGQAQVNPSSSETDTYSWGDNGIFALQRPSSTSNDFNGGIYLIDSRNMGMQLTGDSTTLCRSNEHVHVVDPVTGQVTDYDLPGQQSIVWPSTQFFGQSFPFSLDINGNILADGGHVTSAPVAWGWPGGTIATGAMQWNRISSVAGSAPDPKSAR